jgi:2-polyprenyl-3-methyl-5-hydroxy-6-metoxy-1,4-benzoquinol methylase
MAAYQKIASQWKAIRDRAPMTQCILDLAKSLPPQADVLDVGCGTGYPIAAWFANHGFTVTGIDVTAAMIAYATALALPKATFIHTDILRFHTEKTFDAIIAYDVLFHLAIDQQLPALTHLSGMLKPGGYLLFTHGKKTGEISGKMFEETFYYSSLNTTDYVNHAKSLGLTVSTLIENYQDPTTGDRDLLMVLHRHKS